MHPVKDKQENLSGEWSGKVPLRKQCLSWDLRADELSKGGERFRGRVSMCKGPEKGVSTIYEGGSCSPEKGEEGPEKSLEM